METKEEIRRRRVIVVLLILLVLLTIFTGMFAKKVLETKKLENQAIQSARKYINDLNLQFNETISIPVSMLKDKNYLGYFDEKCLNSSYVIVEKKNDKYDFKPVIVCDSSKNIIKLNGDAFKKLEVGEDYIEEGAIIEGETNKQITIDNSVNIDKLGTYGLTYKVEDLDIPPVLRVVEVVDTTKPILTLKGSDILYLLINSDYIELGFKAIDNYDGDITNKVSIEGSVNTKTAGTYYITYKVTDNSNNVTEVKRQVIVRENIPTINLKGYGTIYLNVFDKYLEEGYSAYDEIDGNITKKVIVSGEVNTNKVGQYVITYKVTNKNGASIIIRRVINVIDNVKPNITLNGKDITLEWNIDTYKELGAIAIDNYDGDITNRIVITGLFNPNKIGTYYLAYTITDNNGNKSSIQRIIKVVDRQAPIVILNGDATMYLEAGFDYNELGVTITDNYDTNLKAVITNNININVMGEYQVTYIVNDSSANKTEITRKVIVRDTTKPVIKLNGESIINLELGTKYKEDFATATDNYDHFVNNNIIINGTVDHLKEGTYYITYDVIDVNNNIADTVTRTVIVKDTIAPIITLTSNDLDKFIKEAIVNVNINDLFNELKFVKYAWTTSENIPSTYIDYNYIKNTDEILKNKTDGTYYLHVQASDMSNNVANSLIGPFTIDNTNPIITIAPNGATGQSITTSITTNDEFSGIDKVYYGWSNSKTEQPTYTLYDNKPLTNNVDGTYYLWVKALDKANNESIEVSKKFIVDNAYPAINFKYDKDITKEITIEVNASALSGKTLTKLEYAWTTNNIEPQNYSNWSLLDYENNKNITMPNNVDGTYYLWIRATDSLGLVSYSSSKKIILDNTLPTITVTPNGSSVAKNKDVNITINEINVDKILWLVSTESDINNVTLTNKLNSNNETIHIENLNGTYYLHVAVLDKAGNYKDLTTSAYHFDNEAPVDPTISYNKDWTNQDVEITISGTDNIKYSFDNKTWLDYDNNNKPKVNSKTTVYTYAIDEALNISKTVSEEITNIDKVKPIITLEYNTEITKKIVVKYNASDLESGIDKVYYAFTTTDVEPSFIDTTTNNEISKNDISGTYYLWFKVYDKAGNELVVKTTLLTLDVIAPIISINNNGTIEPVTKITSTIDITDDNISDIKYIWSTKNVNLDVDNSFTSWYDYSQTNNSLTLDNKYVDGLYYLHIVVLDKAGNSTYVISNVYTLVNEQPIINLDPATNLDYGLQISSQVSASLKNATITNLYYTWSTSTDEPNNWIEFNNNDVLTKNDISGAYYLHIKVVDNVDGSRQTITRSSGTFNLDKTNVNVTFSPNGTLTPIKKAETIITATDIHSGVKTIKYAWGTSNIESPELKEFAIYTTDSILSKETLNTYETYYLWVYTIDQAGNENYSVSNAFVIDNSYPEILLNPNRSNPVNDLIVTVNINVNSNKTLTNIYYVWDTKNTTDKDTVWTTWNLDDFKKDHTLKQSGLNGIYYLHIKVVDSNNLEAIKSSYELIFDNNKPVIIVTPDVVIPVKDVTANVAITEDNNYDVFYSYSKESDYNLAVFTAWLDFTGDAKLTFNDHTLNGTYYLHIKAVDEAGNISYISKEYIIDNTAPNAPTISYNEAWTKENLLITITGTDILQYSLDNITWLDYNYLEVSTNTIIYARSKDLAGNISEVVSKNVTNIDKEKPDVSLNFSPTLTNKDILIDVLAKIEGSPIVDVRWSLVKLTFAEYQSGLGNVINNMKFEQSSNSPYLEVYVRDEAGNEVIVTTSITNIDKENPIIVVNPTTVTIPEDTIYDIFSGVSVLDNVGVGDNKLTATDFTTKQPGTYIVTYSITDLAGNTATSVRTIIVKDTTAPVITLGNNIYEMEVKGLKPTFEATALDNYDSNITVTITDNIDINVVGKYVVTFKALDTNNNESIVTKEFIVKDT
ncbi:MAG: DUF5011 domain-containing protein, partial [Bacilli bacterium]